MEAEPTGSYTFIVSLDVPVNMLPKVTLLYMIAGEANFEMIGFSCSV